jgi:hypothetical protein
MVNNIKFCGILKPCKVLYTNLNLTKLVFVRKLRPKLIHNVLHLAVRGLFGALLPHEAG